MTVKTILLASAGSAALILATPAFAAGTQQGTSITNSVTVSYQVGGVPQTDATAADTFVVDRKINLLVSEASSGATSVSPGQTGAVTSFTVTNASNDTIDFKLEATQQTGGAARFAGTDNYDVSVPTLYRETNTTAGLQTGAGGDTLVTFLDEVAADATVTVYAVANIPLGRVTGDAATILLSATAQEGGTVGTVGAPIAQTAGANTANVVDTVFADTDTANGNVARDGKSMDRDDYLVAAANLSAAKNSVVISDPVNGTASATAFPKMIPGAVIQYCIIVANATGSATATNITLSDTLPTTTTYDAAYGIRVNGTATGGVCDATTGSAGGSFNAGTGVVSGTLSDVGAGVSRTLLFRVSVN